MTIEKQYYIRVEYIPATEDDRRQDGTYLIKHYDEVQAALMAIDDRICLVDGVGDIFNSYVECVVDTLMVAEHIEKVVMNVLTRYNYRVIN